MHTPLKIVVVLALALPLICGCEGGGGDDSPPSVDVTGNWRGTSTFVGETSSESINLTQDGANVSGSNSDGVNYSGSVSGSTLHLTSTVSNGPDSLSLDVSGEVTGDTMVLEGTMKGSVHGTDIEGPITFNLHR